MIVSFSQGMSCRDIVVFLLQPLIVGRFEFDSRTIGT